jgi:hypothetical protein
LRSRSTPLSARWSTFFGASFETRPKPHVRRQLRTLIMGKLERDMPDEERAAADAWIKR